MKALKILQVSPQAADPYLDYWRRSLQKGGETLGLKIEASVLSVGDHHSDEVSNIRSAPHKMLLKGDADKPWTIAADQLIAALAWAEVIHIHHCLSYFGLTVAAHASLLGKCVMGEHRGARDEHFLSRCAEVSYLFDFFHSGSEAAAAIYQNLNRPVKIIPTPVDAYSSHQVGVEMLNFLKEYLS